MTKEKFSLNDIIRADAKNLSKHVKPNSVALTITSPPYRNAINYSKHVKNLNGKKNSRFRGNVGIKTDEYLDEMEKIFSEVLKVTIPGGFCCIVIGDEIDNGSLVPLPSLLISRLIKEEKSEKSWNLRDIIIWNKVTAGRNGAGNRFGIFVQIPIPTYYRSNIMHEYIIILKKGEKNREMDKTKTEKIPLNRAMKRQVALSVWDFPVDEAVMKESKKNVWDVTPVPPRVIDHPAVFPEQIPWRLIKLYSKKGDTILDPMNGSGQTTKVAKILERNYIGVDSRLSYVKLAKKRLNESFQPSNFMVPLYFPIEWSTKDQSGKKEDATLDFSSNVPKGFEYVFEKPSDKEVRGVRGTYYYYKNKENDWLCYIMTRSSEPTKMNVGNFSKPKTRLAIVLNQIPNRGTFTKADLHEMLPPKLVENRQPLKAVIDILVNLKRLKKADKNNRGSELYVKIQPSLQIKPKKKLANLLST